MTNPYTPPRASGPLPESVEITFDQTADDLAAFSVHFYSSSKAARGRRWIVPGFMAVVAIWMILQGLKRDASFVSLFPIFAFLMTLAFLAIFMTRRRVHSFARDVFKDKPQLGILGPLTIRIHPDGIDSFNKYRKGWLSWAAVEKVDRTKNHIFIYHGSASAYVVPRRAFDSEEFYEQFAALAEDLRVRHAEAQSA